MEKWRMREGRGLGDERRGVGVDVYISSNLSSRL